MTREPLEWQGGVLGDSGARRGQLAQPGVPALCGPGNIAGLGPLVTWMDSVGVVGWPYLISQIHVCLGFLRTTLWNVPGLLHHVLPWAICLCWGGWGYRGPPHVEGRPSCRGHGRFMPGLSQACQALRRGSGRGVVGRDTDGQRRPPEEPRSEVRNPASDFFLWALGRDTRRWRFSK